MYYLSKIREYTSWLAELVLATTDTQALFLYTVAKKKAATPPLT